uniref:Phospholipase A2 n=1 Tax=Equus asinus asinus TaxID=83772 RepID=A0A8C4ME71_EQUAS
MIRLMTGKEATSSYGFYGCHCGVGGKGSPKDATDRCCVAHDCCYYRLQKRGCGTKLLNYKFSYRGGKIICGKKDFCTSTQSPSFVSLSVHCAGHHAGHQRQSSKGTEFLPLGAHS